MNTTLIDFVLGGIESMTSELSDFELREVQSMLAKATGAVLAEQIMRQESSTSSFSSEYQQQLEPHG